MSMGFQSFLHNTQLPNWFPLSNLHVGQQKVLSMLNMKKDNNGNVVWDDTARPYVDSLTVSSADLIPMEPRSRYRVCVVGGGIAGLSCCLELFRICERERINVEIVLLEGRSRLGGRLWTDRDTFKARDGATSFPVDLGASWIHGINLNPLAALAREAGVDFVTTSEDVKMFQSDMVEVDSERDENAGQLFDKLLDLAVSYHSSSHS
jgi:Flavin containing amine oxidoreductase